MIVGTNSYCSEPGGFFDRYSREDINVGNYVQVGAEVRFFNQPDHISIYNRKNVHNYPPQMIGKPPIIQGMRGRLTIGHDVWIGNNATLFGGITIGNGAIVGAYSVVSRSVPDYALVYGNRATVIQYRFTQEQINKLNNIARWNWRKEDIMKADMSNVDEFIKKYEVSH